MRGDGRRQGQTEQRRLRQDKIRLDETRMRRGENYMRRPLAYYDNIVQQSIINAIKWG